VLETISQNTSIVKLRVGHGQIFTHTCSIFRAMSARDTRLTRLDIVGDICICDCDAVLGNLLEDVKNLSLTSSNVDTEIGYGPAGVILHSAAKYGKLESLDLSRVKCDDTNDPGGLVVSGIESILRNCHKMESVKLDFLSFGENLGERWGKYSTRGEPAPEFKYTNANCFSMQHCTYPENSSSMIGNLFVNSNIRNLYLRGTKVPSSCTRRIAGMIMNGNIVHLDISDCSISRDGIRIILKSTTHPSSNLTHIGIGFNKLDKVTSSSKDLFGGLSKSSLEYISVDDNLSEQDENSVSEFGDSKNTCTIDRMNN